MLNSFFLFDRALFVPIDVLVWIAVAYIFWRHEKNTPWKSLLFCFFFMISWRFIIRAHSARYYLNLLLPSLFMIMEAGRLFYQWKILFTRRIRRSLLAFLVIVLAGVCIGKTLHNNPYWESYLDALHFVHMDLKDSLQKRALLFTKRWIVAQEKLDPLNFTVMSFWESEYRCPEDLLTEFRNLPDPAYFLLDERSHVQTIPDKDFRNEKKSLRCIQRFRKNRKKDHFLAIYKLSRLSDGTPVMAEKKESGGDLPDSQNLLLNGDFRHLSPLVLSEAKKKMLKENLIDTIRESTPFPDQWTIEATPGYGFNSAPVIKIVSDSVRGKNALLLQCQSLITIRYKQLFDVDSYVLEFDVTGDAKSVFSIAFHEFQKNKYQYTRHCRLCIPESGKTYHVTLPLFKEDFHLARFYPSFELQTGKIELSDIKMKKLNRE